jgi:hypothetical protein
MRIVWRNEVDDSRSIGCRKKGGSDEGKIGTRRYLLATFDSQQRKASLCDVPATDLKEGLQQVGKARLAGADK